VYAIPFWYFFFAGVLIYLVRDKLTFNYLFFVCAVALWIASFRTPSFHAYHILLVPYMVIFLVYMPFPFSQWIEKYIGDISYGIYVYAFPVQQTLVSLTKGQIDFLLFNALSLMITIILATLSWRFVEKPALKLKRLSLWKTTHQTSISS
jgi:peptidoglycan/LPS O-acetylase OafA/YrhL